MKEKMFWLDSAGFPVEHIEGRPVLNWFRDLIHGNRKVTQSESDAEIQRWLAEAGSVAQTANDAFEARGNSMKLATDRLVLAPPSISGFSVEAQENATLRCIIAYSDLPCLYCGLQASEMGKCAYGFPGCGRADAMLVWDLACAV